MRANKISDWPAIAVCGNCGHQVWVTSIADDCENCHGHESWLEYFEDEEAADSYSESVLIAGPLA